LTRDTLQVKDN